MFGVDVFEQEDPARREQRVDAAEERVAFFRGDPVEDVVEDDRVESAADRVVEAGDPADVRMPEASQRLPQIGLERDD